MSSKDQTEIFKNLEGDAWFKRNQKIIEDRLDSYYEKDPCINLLKMLDFSDKSELHIIELGCANGYRLRILEKVFCEKKLLLQGNDVSSLAIEDGKSKFKNIDLRVESLDNVSFQEPADIVIVYGVLCWISRNKLSKAISE